MRGMVDARAIMPALQQRRYCHGVMDSDVVDQESHESRAKQKYCGVTEGDHDRKHSAARRYGQPLHRPAARSCPRRSQPMPSRRSASGGLLTSVTVRYPMAANSAPKRTTVRLPKQVTSPVAQQSDERP